MARKVTAKVKKSLPKQKLKNTPKSSTLIQNQQQKTHFSSMEELLAVTGYQLNVLRRGQQVEGTVVDISPKEIVVDVGAKSEGIISGKEIELASDLVADLKVGDKILATVVYPENEAGQVVLSLRKTGGEKRWEQLIAKQQSEEMLEVKGVEVNRGGLVVDYMGLRGFIPSSQLSQENIGKVDKLVGQVIQARVVEVDKATNRLIFSQRPAVVPQEILDKLSKIKIGSTHIAKVTAVLPFGLFVTINGLEGLVHISELAWERVENLTNLFKVGDEVNVLVLGVDQVNGRLNLSIKQLTEDPWKKEAVKFSKDQKVTGTVTRLTPFGVFVNLVDKVEGLLHISKIPPDFRINVGDKIDCLVESVDLDSKRVSLTLLLKEKPVGYR